MFKEITEFFSRILFPQREREKIVSTISLEETHAFPHPQEKINGVTSLFSYKDARVQSLIWELKYHRNSRALHIVATLMAEEIVAELEEKILFENWIHKDEKILLLPIPMSTQHMRQRKFSQINLLCKEIIKSLPEEILKHIEYKPDTLKKIRETEKQSHTKNRAERLKNLVGAFSADQKIIENKNIILIDDVTTTGATIHEAMRALKTAKAKHILAFTVAH